VSVAVTGYAWRTPLGGDLDGALRRLYAGERALWRNPRFPVEGYACQVAATIQAEPAPSPHQRFLRRMGLFAREAALEACRAAGVRGGDRLGLFFGYGGLRAHWNDLMPGLAAQTPDFARSWERGFKLFHPFWMLQNLSNNAHAIVARDLDARGDGTTTGGANAGAQALAAAIRSLESGACAAACVAAYDTLLEPETLVELAGRGAATGERVSAAYSVGACGFVPGEAAAAIVLEPAETAGGRARSLLDARAGADGSSGAPIAATLAALIDGIGGAPVDLVDGAARCDAAFDAAELGCLPDAPLVATLAAMGQIGAAASVVQAIALTEILRRGLLPPIASLTDETRCDPRAVVAARPTSARSAVALSVGAPGLAGLVRVERA
jgi:3-oxoacyl-(acyl-carrier-protein) synthase